MIRAAIGTNNIDCCARICHSPTAWGMQQTFGTGAATNSTEDIYHADLFMVIGANPTNAHPVTGAKSKQQVMKGKKLIVVDPIMSPLFIAQLITAASYNKLCTQAQQDISVVAYSAAAYLQAMRSSITAQANVNVVYNVTPNLSYSVAV